MPTLRDIRRRITGVANTAKITQAMRMVSAAKLRRSQEAIQSARPYVLKMAEVLKNLVESVGEGYTHPLIQKHKSVQNVAAIIIASDRGLCGSFNNNLFRYAMNFLHDKVETEFPNAKIHVMPIGKRTCLFFKRQKYDVIKEYPGIFSSLNFLHAKEIGNEIVSAFVNEEIDKVYIFFNEFKNIMVQRPATVTLLPIEQAEVKKDASDKNFQIDYIFEPSEKEILDDLLPKHMDIQIWRTLLESFASEQAARMMAMENATKNANDLIKHLELVFNKARQAAITKEMLEIVSGADALKKA